MDLLNRDFELLKRFNSDKNGFDSIFALEVYSRLIKVTGDVDIIAKMEAICKQNDVVSFYVTLAKANLAIYTFNKNE